MPSATASAPARTAFAGHLILEAAPRPDGRTVLVHQSFRAPLHISKPYWDGEVLQVRVINPTAGILEGDQIDLEVRSRGGAALLVTTPAATRAFMMAQGKAECRQLLEVDQGGWMEYFPEPLFAHKNSDYSQVTRLEVARGGELFFCDSLAPGRVGRGECWAWRRLQLTLEVVRDSTLSLRECLSGSGADLEKLARLHAMPEAWFATVVALSPKLEEPAFSIDRVRALHGAGRWVGASRIEPGLWVVRVVAPGSQILRDLLAQIRSAFSEVLPHLRSDLRRL